MPLPSTWIGNKSTCTEPDHLTAQTSTVYGLTLKKHQLPKDLPSPWNPFCWKCRRPSCLSPPAYETSMLPLSHRQWSLFTWYNYYNTVNFIQRGTFLRMVSHRRKGETLVVLFTYTIHYSWQRPTNMIKTSPNREEILAQIYTWRGFIRCILNLSFLSFFLVA